MIMCALCFEKSDIYDVDLRPNSKSVESNSSFIDKMSLANVLFGIKMSHILCRKRFSASHVVRSFFYVAPFITPER